MKKIPSVQNADALYARGTENCEFIKKQVERKAGLPLTASNVPMRNAEDFIMSYRTVCFPINTMEQRL